VSNVSLSIGGRSFTVACAEGEESHVLGLGAAIDDKLAAMGGMSGQSETRMLLFAALLLADELHEAEANPASAPKNAPETAADPLPHVAERLDALAARLENLATRLES
jgi:cell division protein ZapA